MKITTYGGLSVISAFSTGIGASASIDLKMSVSIEEESKSAYPQSVKKTIKFLELKYGKPFDYSIKIESEIPPAVGLKSSSALTSAIVLSYLKMNDISVSEPGAIIAEASRYNHTSATGALDDASCSIYGGLCISDNNRDKIIKMTKLNEIDILICWPRDKIRNSYEMLSKKMSVLGRSVNRLLDLLDSGKIYETMVLNGLIFGSYLESDFIPCGKMYSLGASYSSYSGKGPAIFSIFEDRDILLRAKEEFNMTGYEIIETRFNNKPAKVE